MDKNAAALMSALNGLLEDFDRCNGNHAETIVKKLAKIRTAMGEGERPRRTKN